jgi:hypothetical protein
MTLISIGIVFILTVVFAIGLVRFETSGEVFKKYSCLTGVLVCLISLMVDVPLQYFMSLSSAQLFLSIFFLPVVLPASFWIVNLAKNPRQSY